jgi:hypothetical protein
LITGFNTDIEYDGVVYHVQTEDKGLDSPLILSLVYSGGAILASKRSRYEDLIASGFDEAVLTERLKRQHRLICAAINAGRIEELKRMSGKAETEGQSEASIEKIIETSPEVGEVPPSAPPQPEETIEIIRTVDEGYRDTAPLIMPDLAGSFAPTPSVEASPAVPEVNTQRAQAGLVELPSGVTLQLLDEEEFHAGRQYTIHIMLEDKSALTPKPLGGIPVSVKILGTAFRPQLYSVDTAPNGVAIVSAMMPNFISGRAAVLVRAVVKDETIELRTPIHPTNV